MKFTNANTGCVIDGSHMSSFDFVVAVIDFAISKGFDDLDIDLYRDDLRRWRDESISDHEAIDVLDGVDHLYYRVLDWLNDSVADDDFYWQVEDQCLFFSPDLEQ